MLLIIIKLLHSFFLTSVFVWSHFGLRILFILMIEVIKIFDYKKKKKNRVRHSYWTVLIRLHEGPKMLIWHCTDFVRLLGSNLNDIKTAITGPSRFMCSLIQSKAPSCFANGTHLFSPNILSFLSSVETFACAISKEKRAVCCCCAGTAADTDPFGLSVATWWEVSPSRSNIFLTKWRIY